MKKRRYFQWIAGEDAGNVMLLESISTFEGETFYNFDDGESCNLRYISKMTDNVADLKEKIVVEIESPSNPWTFETVESKKYVDQSMPDVEAEIPTLHDILQANGQTSTIEDSNIGSQKLIPPKKKQRMLELPSIEDYTEREVVSKSDNPIPQPSAVKNVEVDNSIQPKIVNEPQAQTATNRLDPVAIIVNSCKKHDVSVELTLSMQLPSKSMYMIAESEFENGGDKFIDILVDDLDVSEIIKQLKVALKSVYSEKQ